MSNDDMKPVTRILNESLSGNPQAEEELLPLIYEELRARAADHLRRENVAHTLQPTALVHEAYLRLVDGEKVDWNGKTHFFAVAATTLRRVLVDHARAKSTQKRGSGARATTLSEAEPISIENPGDVLDLDEAINKLAESKPRHAKLVELRFFAGFSVEEAADALGVSKETAKVDWRFARAWLNRELS
jgi:RNA polymerase sigma factor (TIGR02999 family)